MPRALVCLDQEFLFVKKKKKKQTKKKANATKANFLISFSS